MKRIVHEMCGLALGGLLALLLPMAGVAQDEARIAEIHLEGIEVVITVHLPDGLRKVTLESRERLGSGTWQPRAVARTDGQSTVVVFRLPASRSLELLRVRGDDAEPLPARFYEGNAEFGPQPAGSSDLRYLDAPWSDVLTGAEGGEVREVVESDIWKVRDDTLYYFNQYRGLQIIDLTDPDAPAVVGTLPLPAVGEEMYLLGERHAILLAGNTCNWQAEGPESRVLIVDVAAGQPTIRASIPIDGWIRESRLVGSVLYVAAESYQRVDDRSWEWGMWVSAHDLTEPDVPVSGDALWFPGYGLAVQATPEFFFVAALDPTDASRSRVRCLDITDPAGRLVEYASLEVRGRVADKFKMNWHEGVLRVASEGAGAAGGGWRTWLETFTLPDPRSAGPVGVGRLASLELGLGERLFATRFDGPRAYLVTYLMIDPLWVVDLSDPAAPRITGELHVPGWSTFIQPMGDRLLAMGIDDTDGRRTAVSLFDVGDPAKPDLITRVSLGEGYSWSEANHNEKAFTVLENEGLVLVPYYGNGTGGYASRVQLIDLNAGAGHLALRGEVIHRFGARRATVHRDRMISVSNVEFLSVDITDRDRPEVRATLPLAWSVDRLLLHGEWLVQISNGDGGLGGGAVRISPRTDSTALVAEVSLRSDWPVIGAAVDGSVLCVVQGWPDWAIPASDPDGSATDPVSNLRVEWFDLVGLPEEPTLLASFEAAVKPLGWGGDYQLLRPRADVWVLAGGSGGGWFYGGLLDGPWMGRPFFGGGGGMGGSRLIAISVTDPARPELAADLDLASPDISGFSRAWVAGPLVYLSRSRLEPPGPIEARDPVTGSSTWIDRPDWFAAYRHELMVIDYTDPWDPTTREPTALPGRLEGVDRAGALLYTVGPHWEPNSTGSYDGVEWLDASAYDGVAAHLVASMQLPTSWPRAVRVHGGQIYLQRAADAATGGAELEAWRLRDSGAFELQGVAKLPEPLYGLEPRSDLLVGSSYNGISVIDIADPAAPRWLVSRQPEACLWLDPVRAVGSRDLGLWFPAGLHGTWHLELPADTDR
jgi:hypothetical protein